MCIRDGDPPTPQKPADRDQLVDHGLVGTARLAIFLDDPLAREKREVRAIAGIIKDVPRHRQPMLAPDLEIVIAMAGGGVDKACARIIGDVITGKHRYIVIPFAIGTIRAAQRVCAGQRR